MRFGGTTRLLSAAVSAPMLKACFPLVPGRMFSFFGFVGGVWGNFGRVGGSLHFVTVQVTCCHSLHILRPGFLSGCHISQPSKPWSHCEPLTGIEIVKTFPFEPLTCKHVNHSQPYINLTSQRAFAPTDKIGLSKLTF